MVFTTVRSWHAAAPTNSAISASARPAFSIFVVAVMVRSVRSEGDGDRGGQRARARVVSGTRGVLPAVQVERLLGIEPGESGKPEQVAAHQAHLERLDAQSKQSETRDLIRV